ncbi:tyrosine-type recombinase/integrase [Planctomycetota bacterium]
MITKIGVYRDPRKKKPWVVRWYGDCNPATGRRQRYSKSFKIKKDAEAYQLQKGSEFNQGELRDKPREVTLKYFCENWFKTRKPQLRIATLKGYRETIERLYGYFGKNRVLSEVTPRMAASFIAELKRLQKGKGDKPLSNWTRKKVLRDCKIIFGTAVTWQTIAKDPFKNVKAPKLATRRWHYLKPEEYNALLGVAPTLRRKALYALAYTAGLRLGEAISLTWNDIDFDIGEVLIENRSATPTIPPFRIKDYEARRIPLPKHTLNILTELHAEAFEGVPFVLLDKERYCTVKAKWRRFQRQGREWQNSDMENNTLSNFKRCLKWAGIEPNGTLSIHTLRKSCGQNWANHLPPNVTKELMGHSNIATTMKYYSQVDEDHRAKAAALVDRLVSKGNAAESLVSETDAKMTPTAIHRSN